VGRGKGEGKKEIPIESRETARRKYE